MSPFEGEVNFVPKKVTAPTVVKFPEAKSVPPGFEPELSVPP